MRSYTVVLSPDPETEVWSVSCPAMPGAVSQGHGREDALRNMQESMEGWLETALEDGWTPAEESPSLVAAWIGQILDDRAAEGWDLRVETATIVPKLTAPVS